MLARLKPLRIATIIPSLTAGGIGPVCQYAAEGMARSTDWEVILLCLHDPKGEGLDKNSGLRTICLGLDENCAVLFLDWLAANPQDLLITSDVSRIETAFPFLPRSTRHIVQVHDSVRRYREVAVRNQEWINGITCVGHHIEAPLRVSLDAVGYKGLLRTIHNGANFPQLKPRIPYDGPLRLLFMGRIEAIKGVFDFVPILHQLKKRGITVSLNIVGGENETLRSQFQRKGLNELVTWTGRIPHAKCYNVAAESDIFLMTSRKEPFGMVTIEAMSMGCVPLAYNVPSGSTEIIEHGRSGMLVPLGNYKKWVATIESLHHDRALLSELSEGAILRARSYFNEGVMAENMIAFVRDVLNHAESCPSRREGGYPPPQAESSMQKRRGYQLLPESLRIWIRNKVCSYPRLSHWLLSR